MINLDTIISMKLLINLYIFWRGNKEALNNSNE